MNRFLSLIRHGWAWFLDYVYVTRWQIRGFLIRRDPAPYLKAGVRGADPVVLIPGIYETWQFMEPVAEHLHRLGHPVHVVRPLGYNRGTVAAMAALVADYIHSHALENVTIVAHSKGGLIGKYVMTTTDAGGSVARMVAVNTPFNGSIYADFALAPSIRAFSRRNRVLRTLLRNIDVNHRIASIYSSFDPHIPGGSYLPGARNIRLDTMGHFRIIGDRRLLETIEETLRDVEREVERE